MINVHPAAHRAALMIGLACCALSSAAIAAGGRAADPGVRKGSSAGGALAGLSADQMALFMSGQHSFQEVETLGDGLGPRFNLDSCGGCHSFPEFGGTSPAVNPQPTVATAFGAHNAVPGFITQDGPIREVRYKFAANGARDGGVHSLFVISGRSDAGGNAVECNATQEDFNAQFSRGNVSLRIPTPVFGGGLIESISDDTLAGNLQANRQRKSQFGIAGHLNTEGNDGRVSRFGWKAQNISLLMFAGEAYNVEMGVSNELFPIERDGNPTCQTAGTPNDITDKTDLSTPLNAFSDVEKFAFFMRFSAAPVASTSLPGGADSITRGRQVFNDIGCALCHTPALTTGGAQVKALAHQQVPLYSDLAVHHMGPRLADNIVQGSAGPDEFRTAPLWGLGQRIYFLHDGRTSNLVEAIDAHQSGGDPRGGPQSGTPSEANRVVNAFDNLSGGAQQDLLNFLRSL